MNGVIPMSILVVRDMQAEDEYFVTTCSHVNESIEIDACAEKRRQQFKVMTSEGAVFKVAIFDHDHVGFAYGIPIESSSWGPHGHSLMVLPCLYVLPEWTSKGAGKALIAAIEDEARRANCHAVTITAYRELPDAEWFMPASYFELLGYTPVESRGREVLLWKPLLSDAVPPHFLQPHYVFEPIEGSVVVDLFWNLFCQTSVIEAERVREVCSEFGDQVVLREFEAEDRKVLLQYQISRAIYVNGREIGWGVEAPKDGIRDAILQALPMASK
jgi:GNAT superfamily N-acetyltransferase